MSWQKRPTAFAKTVVKDHGDQCRRAGLEILSRVVLSTPVDTGRARGNWQTTLNAPATAEVERLDPSGASAISDGTGTINGAPQFPLICIANNLPYIGALNYGKPPGKQHSKQAPLQFVELAVQGVLDEL